MNGAAKLNRPEYSGRQSEDQIAAILRAAGARVQYQYPLCRSIYGEILKVDYYISNSKAHNTGLAIELKWQETNGSVDEKFPYLVENIRQQYPCPAIVVFGGRGARPGDKGGARPGAIRWLRAQVDHRHLIGVLTIEELMHWTRSQEFLRTGLF